MSQVVPAILPNADYTRRLYRQAQTGEWEVVNANLTTPINPPIPTYKNSEVQVINAPSAFLGLGVGSYTVSLTLLFSDDESFKDFLRGGALRYKYTDERGYIFVGLIKSIKSAERFAGSQRYTVSVEFTMNKQINADVNYTTVQYDDINFNAYATDIQQVTFIGTGMGRDDFGNQMIAFLPNEMLDREQFYGYLVRTIRYLRNVVAQ